MVNRSQPIKWADRVPKEVGVHAGEIYGQPFSVEIFTNRPHSHRTTWTIEFEFLSEKWGESGESGGIQRAMSCLRDSLETICTDKGIER